jgi:hypothetical protein
LALADAIRERQQHSPNWAALASKFAVFFDFSSTHSNVLVRQDAVAAIEPTPPFPHATGA